METQIVEAIQAKKLLSFTYDGLPRVAEPHVYGIHDGTAEFLGYQIRGSSSSGSLPNWRRFKLHLIQNLRTLNEEFPGRRSHPSGKHSGWDRQIAAVE